ncbi:MAG: SCO family protein [Rufibacter sp.]
MKTLLTLFAVVLTMSFAGCQEAAVEQPAVAQTEAARPAQTHSLSDLSLYQLEGSWTNQDGKEINLKELQGKPVLVAMIYASCGFACPRTVADLQRIEKGLAHTKLQDFKIVLATIDPERDTPARLKQFAEENGLDLDRWQLLTAQPETIQELAALLNVKYRKALNGEFAHSNLISVLNAQGELVHQQQGLGAAPEPTIDVMKGLLAPQ